LAQDLQQAAEAEGGGPEAPSLLSRQTARLAPAWMDRNLWLLWWARLAMSAARAVAGVVTSLYLADLGLSSLELAGVFMAIALSSAVLSTATGLMSDRVGKKPFLIAFPLIAAGAALVFATTTNIAALVLAASAGSFGRGGGAGAGAVGPYQPAESAMATASVAPRWRNAAFGRLAFASGLGALGGGLLASLARATHGRAHAALSAYRPAFLAAALASVLAGLLAVFIQEKRSLIPKGASRRPSWPTRSWPLLLRLWVTNTINGAAVGMFGPFVSYWFYRRFGVGPGEIGQLFAVVNLVTLPSVLSAAGLARRYGLIRALVVIRLVQAVLLIPMVLAGQFLAAGAIFAIRMMIQRVGMPLRQSYVLGMAHPEERASVAALSNVPSQLAMGASPLLTGWLFSISLAIPFEIAGGLQALSAVAYWLFFRTSAPEEEREAPGRD